MLPTHLKSLRISDWNNLHNENIPILLEKLYQMKGLEILNINNAKGLEKINFNRLKHINKLYFSEVTISGKLDLTNFSNLSVFRSRSIQIDEIKLPKGNNIAIFELDGGSTNRIDLGDGSKLSIIRINNVSGLSKLVLPSKLAKESRVSILYNPNHEQILLHTTKFEILRIKSNPALKRIELNQSDILGIDIRNNPRAIISGRKSKSRKK